MSNSDNKPKKKWKLWQKILLIIGIIVLVLGIAAGAAFLYFRRTFGGNAPTVTIGEAVDEAVVETTGGLVRGYISNGIYTYHGIPYASAPERFVAAQPVQKWESYTMETGAEMILDKESYVSYNHDLELLRLLNPGYDLD